MSKIRKLYVLLIIMSVLVCLYGVYQRIRVEKEYNRYEMVMGLQDIKIFASEGGRDLIDVLKTFKKIGIHTVIVDEASIESLKENERYRLRTEYHGPDIHLQAEPELLKFIEDGIKRTIKDDRKIYYASPDVLVIEGRLSDINSIKKTNNLPEEKVSEIEKMGLGYLEQELHFLKKLQIRYALRPSFSPKLQDGKKTIDAFFAAVSKHNPNQNFILFGGKKILGGPENLAYLQEMTERFHMIPIIIENGQQDGNIDIAGVRDLVRSMDYRTVRLFSTWPFIQKRYDYGISGHHEGQEIVNTYYRAITERNIRIIYFRLFVTPGEEYVTDLNIYQQRLAELRERLDYFYGIKPVVDEDGHHPLQTMEKLEISKKTKVFAIFGTIVACLLIAEEVIAKYRKIRLGLWGLSVVVMLGSIAMYRVRVEQFYALLATVAFATLSVVYLMKRVRYYLHRQTEKSCCYKSLLKAAAELLVCIVISLAGAVFVVVLYGSSNYLFEFSKFVGVKASQMMPLLLTILLYFSVIGMNGAHRPKESPWSQVRDVLQRNVKVWQMLLLAGVAGILAIMTLRSGHTSNIEPPSFELWFRNLLELITPARPRTKAIFLGFPALLILIVLADKKYFRSSYILFLLAATIGQANILNSFSHIRTPLLVSLYRVMGEYVVSLLFALIFVVLFDLAERVYREVRKRMGVNA